MYIFVIHILYYIRIYVYDSDDLFNALQLNFAGATSEGSSSKNCLPCWGLSWPLKAVSRSRHWPWELLVRDPAGA